MNKAISVLVVSIIVTIGFQSAVAQEGCTAAIVSPQASADGRPVLWKNRDTDALSNKVVFVQDLPYSYLGLTDADDGSGRKCFAGLNSAGFGIFNTVAYNLPSKPGETVDLEGIIMADALRTCRTVEDFEEYVKANLGPKFGGQANFGVQDATGKVLLFEVYNHGYQKLDASLADEKYLVVTNFSRSGKEGDGAGYLRFERASELFRRTAPQEIAFEDILNCFTRDVGHVLLRYPDLDDLKTTPADEDRWLSVGDCISRPSTASAVVIVGRHPGDPHSLATLWVIPGQPLCAIAVPVWVEAGCSPDALWDGPEAPLWKESLRVKGIIQPYKELDRKNYFNVARLDNAEGTGFLPLLRRTEKEIFIETGEFLKTDHTPEELAAFQKQMAEKALAAMKSIR